MIKVLIIDNNDSFTYNLVEVFRQLPNCSVDVAFLEDIEHKYLLLFDAFVLSPGPGLPSERKALSHTIKDIIELNKPLLGVCLGHQAIAEYFTGKLIQLKRIIHGEASKIKLFEDYLFNDMPKEIEVGRYHSWVVDKDYLPKEFSITSETKSGLIMSVRHKKLNVRGVQFHPESILTKYGNQILANWLAFCLNKAANINNE